MTDILEFRSCCIPFWCTIADTSPKIPKQFWQISQGDPIVERRKAYLPGVEVNRDHEGGSSGVRLGHCTSAELTSAIIPNVNNSCA